MASRFGAVGIDTAKQVSLVHMVDKGMPGTEIPYGNAGVISLWSIIPQALPGRVSDCKSRTRCSRHAGCLPSTHKPGRK